jgi:hypothetical protein
MIGTTQMLSGRLVVAENRLAAASRLYDPERDRALLASTGQEPGVSIDCFMAHTLLLRGFPDRARRHIDAAVRVATELRHALTLAYVVGHETVFWLFAGDGERAVVPAERNRTFSEIHSIRSWEIWTFGFAVVLHSLAGRYEDALAAAERARPQFEASGTGLFLPLMLSGELRSLIALGRYASCEERLREVFARIEASGEHWIEADIHRIEGDLRVAEGDPAAAERCYRRAIDLACDQEAKLFELRATTSLARLWTERGERQRALDLLAPVYDWFTEGFDTPDLVEAKALLDALR